ncbi:hypothetical protein EDB19DRAFT_1827261 [Suillus lakei]|nr:hypothetical protein EDB19DRAFT_1827261 [Suillus lakei]
MRTLLQVLHKAPLDCLLGCSGLLKEYEQPIYPGFGTHGEPVTLVANFTVKIINSLIYMYYVKVEATRNAKDIQHCLLLLLEQTNNQNWQSVKSFVAFEGREMLVSAKKLPQPMQICVRFFKEGQMPGPNLPEYTISIELLHKWEIGELKKYLHWMDGSMGNPWGSRVGVPRGRGMGWVFKTHGPSDPSEGVPRGIKG